MQRAIDWCVRFGSQTTVFVLITVIAVASIWSARSLNSEALAFFCGYAVAVMAWNAQRFFEARKGSR